LCSGHEGCIESAVSDDSESAVSELNRVAGDVGARRGERRERTLLNCEDKSNIRTGVNLFSLSRTIWSSHIVRSGVAEKFRVRRGRG
jgi:hypothetical protein